MAEKLGVYKCAMCGNIIEVLHSGPGELACCNQPMVLQAENTVDAAKEKHVPVITRNNNSLNVKVGDVAHPMEEKHFIEWIEVIDEERISIQMLKPGQKPEADFNVNSDTITVRAYCNLHGLWKA